MGKKEVKPAYELQTPEEEVVNVLTHALGILLAFVLIPILVMKAAFHGSVPTVLTVAVFSFGFILTYLSSTLYHWVKKPKMKSRLQVMDHMSIFIMIGGTYTPVVFRYLEFSSAVIFMSVMWSIIALGSFVKIFHTGKYDGFSTLVYLALGWMIIFIIKPILATMPLEVFLWIMAGGAFYSLGIIFYRWEKLKFNHGIWHLFVLVGTIMHYVAIYKLVG